MKLKTLKDLNCYDNDYIGNDDPLIDDFIRESDLKQEAIKWIKEFREILQLHKDHLTLYGKICEEHRAKGKYPFPEIDSRITKLNKEIEEKEKVFKFLFCDEYDCQTNFIDFIKHFFNITEDDLK